MSSAVGGGLPELRLAEPGPAKLGAGLAAALLLAGCSGGSTAGPDTPACATGSGFRICTERSLYAPGEAVDFSIQDLGTVERGPVFHDGCALEIVFRTDPTKPFPARYDHAGRCGNAPTEEEIRAAHREVPPGETVDDRVSLSPAAPQGEHRLNLWFLDEEGELIDPDPVRSGIFEVRRGGR